MSFKLKMLPLAVAQVVAGGALSMIAAVPTMAQTSTDATTGPVQRVEITGSNIRRADAEIPSPVQVITADDLKKSGYTSIAQVLQNITANGQGTLSQGFPQAFAAGASGISLHGLTTAATLVLIDGHRMAPYPLSDDGQRSFVDVSNIPFDAVERVEILKDGASATYGSDAMAGVVNIILKKTFTGTTVSAEAGTTTQGGGTTEHLTFSKGWGDYEADGYNAYINLEYRNQNDITYGQRKDDGLWAGTDLTSIGGVNKTPGVVTPLISNPPMLSPYLQVYNPNGPASQQAFTAANTYFYPSATSCAGGASFANYEAGACGWQNSHDEIQPATQNINILTSLSKKLSDDWRLDAKVSLFDSKAEQYAPTAGGMQTYPGSFSPLVAVSSGVAPYLVGTTIPAITVPVGYPGNPFNYPATVNGVIPGVGPIHTGLESKAWRAVFDLTGEAFGWDIDSSFGWTKVGTVQKNYNAINVPALNAALNAPNGSPQQWNVQGGNSQALINSIFPTAQADDVSTLEFVELHASRSLMQLPGGDLGFSTGVEFLHRDMDSPAPGLIADGVVPGNNAYVSGSQSDASAYVEVAAPVVKSLELDGSLRFDHFNNAGNATTPKVGFKWTPTSAFALRGTAATGFRAPNAAENGESGQAYLYNTINDPVLCPGGAPTSGGNIAKGSVVSTCSFQPVYLNSSNPALEPEKSVSETLGVILEPIKGWSSTIDAYQVKIKDQIIAGSPNLADAVRGSPVASACADGNGGTYTCTPSAGPIIYIPVQYINANSTQTSGIEFDTRYKWKMGDFGNLTTDLQWTHVMSYILTTGGEQYQLAGTHGPYIIGGDTGNPKDRVQATFTWDKGPWQVATTFNWMSSFSLTDPSIGLDDCNAGASVNGWFPTAGSPGGTNPPGQYCKVASFLDTDVSFHYNIDKQWTVHGAITNLFNQAPPLDLNTYGGGQLPYNPSMHMAGAIGRFVNLGASYKF